MREQKHTAAILELDIFLWLVLGFAIAGLIHLSWENQKSLSEQKNEDEKLQ